MLSLPADDVRAVAIVTAIQGGDTETLQQRLRDSPDLAAARIVDPRGVARTLLHVAADWPGHFPNGANTVAALIAAGADINARVIHQGSSGPPETALHWAASNDDVDVIDALLDMAGGCAGTARPRRPLLLADTTAASRADHECVLERVSRWTAGGR